MPSERGLSQDADGFRERDGRIDGMQLVEVHALDAQAPQAALARRSQVLGSPVGSRLPRRLADRAALGGDDEIRRVRVQRLGHKLLADVRAVGVGGIDELHAKVDCAAQQSARGRPGREAVPSHRGP